MPKLRQLRTGWALPYLKRIVFGVRENHAGCPAVSGKLNEWFNANVLQGVCEVLEPEGYDVSPTFVTGRQETERYFAKLPKNRNADAIIISSFQLDESAREKLRVTDMRRSV